MPAKRKRGRYAREKREPWTVFEWLSLVLIVTILCVVAALLW